MNKTLIEQEESTSQALYSQMQTMRRPRRPNLDNFYTALPVPPRLALSTLVLLLTDDTDVVEDVESLLALRAAPTGPGVTPGARDDVVPGFEAAARD